MISRRQEDVEGGSGRPRYAVLVNTLLVFQHKSSVRLHFTILCPEIRKEKHAARIR